MNSHSQTSVQNAHSVISRLSLGIALAFTAASLSLPACSTSPAEQEREQKERLASDVKDEVSVGRAMAAKLAGSLGIYDGPGAEELNKYLNLVGASLAQRSGRPELTYHFAVLKSDEVNAYATPGGYIFITIGLARALRSEAELAGVLGHEIGHVTERHMSKEIMPKRDVSTGEIITRMLSRGSSDVAFSMSRIVNNGLEMLLVKGMGAEREHDADCAGITYASASGYDPTALFRFLDRLQNSDGSIKVSKTHPPFAKRLGDLEKFMAKNGVKFSPARTNEAELQKRFRHIATQIRPRTA